MLTESEILEMAEEFKKKRLKDQCNIDLQELEAFVAGVKAADDKHELVKKEPKPYSPNRFG